MVEFARRQEAHYLDPELTNPHKHDDPPSRITLLVHPTG
jgi:hypothetical protein